MWLAFSMQQRKTSAPTWVSILSCRRCAQSWHIRVRRRGRVMKSARLRCTMLLVASSFVLALLLLPTPQKTRTRMSRSLALLVVPAAAWHMQAQGAETPYPKMAPLDQYLMERDAEIGLARS